MSELLTKNKKQKKLKRHKQILISIGKTTLAGRFFMLELVSQEYVSKEQFSAEQKSRICFNFE